MIRVAVGAVLEELELCLDVVLLDELELCLDTVLLLREELTDDLLDELWGALLLLL